MIDDLADLFNEQPAGPSMDMRYRQGVILEFDPNTLANQVNVGGTILTDLPILGVGEATLLVSGSVVGIISVISSKGTATWAILGRMVVPNTPDAANATSLLSSWVHAQSVPAQETNTVSANFTDLATIGPQVQVTVRATGRVLVMITSQLQWLDATAASGAGGVVSVALSGANTIAPNTVYLQLAISSYLASASAATFTDQGTYTATGVLEGLNPGLTTFTMKYINQVSGKNVDYGRRNLVVISL